MAKKAKLEGYRNANKAGWSLHDDAHIQRALTFAKKAGGDAALKATLKKAIGRQHPDLDTK